MSNFNNNIVTQFPSKLLGTLFKNQTDSGDPNIYILFCAHVLRVDTINTTFLTFENKTLTAKILNVNIWLDVAVAVVENPSQITFEITTNILDNVPYTVNQSVSFYTNYNINDSLVREVPSEIRVPNYNYPQDMNYFFYPESVLLKENQGIGGFSGSPLVDSNKNVIGIVSKILGNFFYHNTPDAPSNLICTKTRMFYKYLFNSNIGLISNFYRAWLINPEINSNLNLLVDFRNKFNIIICHIGFKFESYKNITSENFDNLSPEVNGILLSFRITGINSAIYKLVDFLQKNDPEITYYRNLLDGSDLMNEYYKDKTDVLLKYLTFTDWDNKQITLDLGEEGISYYYVNGDPSKPITIQYRIKGPAGPGGINIVFGPLKSLTVTPFLVKDGDQGVRYTSQLPRFFTSSTSRSGAIIIASLYGTAGHNLPYCIRYSWSFWSWVRHATSSVSNFVTHTVVPDIVYVANDAGSGLKTAVDDIGSGIKTAVDDIGSGIKTAADDVGSALKNIGEKIKDAFDTLGKDLKVGQLLKGIDLQGLGAGAGIGFLVGMLAGSVIPVPGLDLLLAGLGAGLGYMITDAISGAKLRNLLPGDSYDQIRNILNGSSSTKNQTTGDTTIIAQNGNSVYTYTMAPNSTTPIPVSVEILGADGTYQLFKILGNNNLQLLSNVQHLGGHSGINRS